MSSSTRPRTHEQVAITKNGSPAALLIAVEEWELIQETLFWWSQPGIGESIATIEFVLGNLARNP
jgi:antitoxin YefM